MPGITPKLGRVRFGTFELSVETGELRDGGVRLNLSGQPIEVLAFLIATPGELVTREQLQARLWPASSFGDFEKGLNAAISRLREFLNDSIAEPKYIETVRGRGYRFIAEMRVCDDEVRPLDHQPSLSAPAPASIQAYLLPTENADVLFTGPNAGPAVLSPDGRRMAFTARYSGNVLLFVQSMESSEIQPLFGTEGASYPFWSYDGRSIGFFTGGKLKRVEATGGAPITLCNAPTGRGGAWNQDGTIIFTPSPTDPLYRVSAFGGPRQQITVLDALEYTSHRWPHFLPDGQHFVFLGVHPLRSGGIYVGSLDCTAPKFLMQSYWNASYAAPGYLLFVRDDALCARRFDLERLEVDTDDFALARQIMGDAWVQRAVFSASDTGLLIYQRGNVPKGPQLAWYQRTGKQRKPLSDEGSYAIHRLAPDGNRLAVTNRFGADSHIWLLDLVRNTRTRLTFKPYADVRPVWSPEGTHLVFSCRQDGASRIYRKASSGVGEEELLSECAAEELVESWSADGKFLASTRREPSHHTAEVWIHTLSGEQQPYPLLQDRFDKCYAQFSPDGHWLAYASNESGIYEIYIVPFPVVNGRWQVSDGGGTFPRWRGDGMEIFYLGPDNRLRSTQIAAHNNELEIGQRHVLFEVQTISPPASPFDVTADGKRFLVNSMPAIRGSTEPLTLLTSWPNRAKN